MFINNTCQTNFNGGFRFANMPQKSKEKLPELINKGKAIFEDFEKQGDVFLVARDSHNEKVMNFIKDEMLKFEFYPSINTDMAVQYNPKKLSGILAELKDAPIKTLAGMKDSLEAIRIKKIQEYSPEHVTNILKTLCIDNKNFIEPYKGGYRIVDNEFNKTIYITQPSKFGMYYVKVRPNTFEIPTIRYMMNNKGNVLAKFDDPDSMRVFESRFKELLK